jgi:hypothetical protein
MGHSMPHAAHGFPRNIRELRLKIAAELLQKFRRIHRR